jgi:biotin/methionine sulfoxide reductase
MIRKGWLEKGPRVGDNARGAEPFVSVPWDEALDIVAGELRRVKEKHGNEGIFAGSYGWASAGRFHHAQSQLRRFFNMWGGHAYSVNSYSTAAGDVILTRIMGGFRRFYGQMHSWDQIAQDSELAGRHIAAAHPRNDAEELVLDINRGHVAQGMVHVDHPGDAAFAAGSLRHTGATVERARAMQNFIAVPAPLFAREAALRVGGMDAALWYTADWDFCDEVVGQQAALGAW